MSNATAERALLSLAIDHADIFWRCEQAGLDERKFTSTERQRIYRFLKAAHNNGTKPDRLLVASKIEASRSENCILELAAVPTYEEVPIVHAEGYLREVMAQWKRKRFDQLSREAKERMKEDPDAACGWLAGELAQLESSSIDVKTVDAVAAEVEEGWKEAAKGRFIGVPSWSLQMNNIIGCYRKKIVTGIGAATNAGKSIMAKQEFMHCGMELKHPVALITPEDPDDMVVSSMAGMYGKVDTFALDMGLKRGNIQEGITALEGIKGYPMFIVDMPMTGELLESTMTLLKAKYGVEFMIIDHLHYIRQPDIRETRAKYEHIMGIISGATKTLEVSTLMFAQLSREANKSNRPPRLSDFKETGSIENEIRIGGMLWIDPRSGHRIIHVEKCKGYASPERLIHLQGRSDNIPGFDNVPLSDRRDKEEVFKAWTTAEDTKGAWR